MKEIEYEGITYIIGNNAKENWTILQESNQNWIWFHLDNLTSPYVILKESLKNLKSDVYEYSWKGYIVYAGILCKENSKYKNQNVNCIWTEVKNVSKGKKVGEAIIKGKIQKFKI